MNSIYSAYSTRTFNKIAGESARTIRRIRDGGPFTTAQLVSWAKQDIARMRAINKMGLTPLARSA